MLDQRSVQAEAQFEGSLHSTDRLDNVRIVANVAAQAATYPACPLLQVTRQRVWNRTKLEGFMNKSRMPTRT